MVSKQAQGWSKCSQHSVSFYRSITRLKEVQKSTTELPLAGIRIQQPKGRKA